MQRSAHRSLTCGSAGGSLKGIAALIGRSIPLDLPLRLGACRVTLLCNAPIIVADGAAEPDRRKWRLACLLPRASAPERDALVAEIQPVAGACSRPVISPAPPAPVQHTIGRLKTPWSASVPARRGSGLLLYRPALIAMPRPSLLNSASSLPGRDLHEALQASPVERTRASHFACAEPPLAAGGDSRESAPDLAARPAHQWTLTCRSRRAHRTPK